MALKTLITSFDENIKNEHTFEIPIEASAKGQGWVIPLQPTHPLLIHHCVVSTD